VVEQEGEAVRPVGIVTDRDLVMEVLAEGVEPSTVTVSDIMNTEVVIAAESDDFLQALDRMRNEGVRRMPVIGPAGRLAGILAVDDALELLAEAIGRIPQLVRHERRKEVKGRP